MRWRRKKNAFKAAGAMVTVVESSRTSTRWGKAPLNSQSSAERYKVLKHNRQDVKRQAQPEPRIGGSAKLVFNEETSTDPATPQIYLPKTRGQGDSPPQEGLCPVGSLEKGGPLQGSPGALAAVLIGEFL